MATPFSSHGDFAQAAHALVEITSASASTREGDGGSGDGNSTRRDAPSLLRPGNDVGWSWRQPAGPYGKGYLFRSQVVRPSAPSAVSTPPANLSPGSPDDPLARVLPGSVDEDDDDPATVSAMPAFEVMQLTHHIVFSPSYRVPQLLLSAHSLSSGAPTPLADLLASALVRPPASVALSAAEHGALHLPAEEPGGADFPLLSLAEHPATGETVWALHPCHLADAVDEILAADERAQDGAADAVGEGVARAPPSSARWLQTWLMVVGSVVDLRWWSG